MDGTRATIGDPIPNGRFWVKAFDTPTVWQTTSFAKVLGVKIRTFVGCEEHSMYGADQSLCKVDIDIHKPLTHGINVKVDGKLI